MGTAPNLPPGSRTIQQLQRLSFKLFNPTRASDFLDGTHFSQQYRALKGTTLHGYKSLLAGFNRAQFLISGHTV